MKKEFDFEIDYYKPNGKWYTNERFKMKVASCGPKHREIPYNPVDVFDASFGPGRQNLPGLSGKTWEGYAVLAHIETFRSEEGAEVTERCLSYLMDWSKKVEEGGGK